MSTTTLDKSMSSNYSVAACQLLDELLYRICEKLQLSESQYRLAEERYNAIGDWLAREDSPLHKYNPHIYPQGSLNIGTTVKPKGREEFDLDLVCELRIVDVKQSDPYALIKAVYDRIAFNNIYKNSLVPLKKRCVRLKYAMDFHLDILPACPDTDECGTCVWVPNKYDKVNNRWDWTASNPLGYADWFESRTKLYRFEKMAIEGIEPIPKPEHIYNKSPLKLSVQLLKRWRDIVFENRDDVPSIILTTLAAKKYNGESTITDCLTAILNGIVAEIGQTNEIMYVPNPTNAKENLSEKWHNNPDLYDSFCLKVRQFNEHWISLLHLRGLPKISNELYSFFGEDVVRRIIAEYTQSIGNKRDKGNLNITKNTGILTTSKSAKTIPVRRNTFYGTKA
jgi:hypothetical protein